MSWEATSDVFAGVDARLPGTAVLVIAFVKARYILLEFMELRHAPLALRLMAEAWPLIVCAAVVFFFYQGAAAPVPGNVQG